ncbi:NF-X1-type zinc finger protein NFXL1-like [Paramacrobiotus metropolitanus]|uniref:NF-X1-type zinc finger protein NFXL1-like n=1 Tax=Paramacrobiotus metropolitanus TaxID=2943436 RepID=UPI002445A3C7|nr:NF-X1-type zinc finger protein NFXL1-like [Paramacrobiotus metropolitanus]
MSNRTQTAWQARHVPAKKDSKSAEHSSVQSRQGNDKKMTATPATTSGYSNLERFGAISKQHQDGISKKLEELKQKLGDEIDSDEEDAPLANKEEIFSNIIRQYNVDGRYGGNGGAGDSIDVRRILGNASSVSASTCLVCISSLKRTDPLWNCENCASSFHLGCIQKWAKDGVIRSSSFLSDEYFPEKDRFWACPKCRFEYKTQNAPTRYYCFCGKTVDPPNDPWILPHSCGQLCEKHLKSNCEHRCVLLCHPGPCPPCPATCSISCFCGKKKHVARCGTAPASCGTACGKMLSCGKHSCRETCHPGDCQPCEQTLPMKCACGTETLPQPCGTREWHCQRICGKTFACGAHKCSAQCHSGSCGPCPRSMPRSCPCGKTKAVTDCIAEIQPCNNTCGKPVCGHHFCLELCHFGECGPCMQSTKKTCPCGAKTKQLPCSKDFTCDTKCKSMRNCNRHACNKRCCMGNCPPCDQICGRMLSCRTHKCDSLCHSGPCYPCSQMVDLGCACGRSVISVPCGRQRSVKAPKCSYACEQPPNCHHSVRTRHPCHFGKCPPCVQICEKRLGCGHTCQAKCHSAVEVTLRSDSDRPAGPWEMKAVPDVEIRNYPCPPCEQLVPVPCFGGHDETLMKCYLKRIASCGRPCGRKMDCGNHLCPLPCHELEGAAGDVTVDAACEECTSLCTRATPCGHPCILPCHHGPCSQCAEIVRIKCHCQSMILKFSCAKVFGLSEEEKRVLFSCKAQCPSLLTCGHPCSKLCHIAVEPHSNISDCKKKVQVKCPCGNLKEQHSCNKVTSGYKLACNAECQALADAKRKEEEQRVQDAADKKLKAEQELQEQYDRKMRGRKRRRDRRGSADDQQNFVVENWKHLTGGAVFLLLLAILLRSFQVI